MIGATEDLADVGEASVKAQGCLTCPSLDGMKGVSATSRGRGGREECLTDGSPVTVDDEYFRGSIECPNTKVGEGFAPVVLLYQFTEEEFEAVIAYAVIASVNHKD